MASKPHRPPSSRKELGRTRNKIKTAVSTFAENVATLALETNVAAEADVANPIETECSEAHEEDSARDSEIDVEGEEGTVPCEEHHSSSREIVVDADDESKIVKCCGLRFICN